MFEPALRSELVLVRPLPIRDDFRSPLGLLTGDLRGGLLPGDLRGLDLLQDDVLLRYFGLNSVEIKIQDICKQKIIII